MDTPLPGSELSRQQARSLLAEIGRLQHGTRVRLLSQGWQWLVVWSLVCLGAAVSSLLPWTVVGAWYWAVAVPVAIAATAVLDVRAQRHCQVRRRNWPYWMVGAAITVLNTVGSVVLPPEVLVIWLWVVLATGFAAIMAIDRVYWGAWVMGTLAVSAVAAGLVVADTFVLYPILAVSHAAALAVAALGVRRMSPVLP